MNYTEQGPAMSAGPDENIEENPESNVEACEDDGPKTTLISRNITVQGRRTSIRLEPEMWAALREIATREQCTIHDICTLISLRKKPRTSLTAAIRVFLMLYFKAATTEDGHVNAGHGDFEFMKKRARISSHLVSLFSRKKKPQPDYGASRPGFGRENPRVSY